MKRRTFFAAAAVSLTPMLAGCSGGSVETVSVTEATVEAGETATISVTAPDLSGLHIAEFPEPFQLDGPLDLGEATFNPPPEAVWQAHPPYWSFSDHDTEGTVRIRTTPDTVPDVYRFGFEFDLAGKDDPRYEATTVTVEDRSG